MKRKKKTSYDIAAESGMLSRDEVELIKKCARMLPSNPVAVNIGAGAGASVCAMIEERHDIYIFSVDKNFESSQRERKALQACKLLRHANCFPLIGSSWTVGRRFPYQIDLCFVDGAHHYEAVVNDIEAWRPKVKLGGIMIFHDYRHPNYKGKEPNLDLAVNQKMADCEVIGRARYMIAFRAK